MGQSEKLVISDTIYIQEGNLDRNIAEKNDSFVSPAAHRTMSTSQIVDAEDNIECLRTFPPMNLEILENGKIESNRVYRIPEVQDLQCSSLRSEITPSRIVWRRQRNNVKEVDK